MGDLSIAAECFFLLKKIENEVWWNNCYKYEFGTVTSPPFFVHICDQIEERMNQYRYQNRGDEWEQIFDKDPKEGWNAYRKDVEDFVINKWVPSVVSWQVGDRIYKHEVDIEFIRRNYFVDYKSLGKMTIVSSKKFTALEDTIMSNYRGEEQKMKIEDIKSLLKGWCMTEEFQRVDRRLSGLGKRLQAKKGSGVASFNEGFKINWYHKSSIKYEIFKFDKDLGCLIPKNIPEFKCIRGLPDFFVRKNHLAIAKPVNVYPEYGQLAVHVPAQVIFKSDGGYIDEYELCLYLFEAPMDLKQYMLDSYKIVYSDLPVDEDKQGTKFLESGKEIIIDNGKVFVTETRVVNELYSIEEISALIDSAVLEIRQFRKTDKKNKNSKNNKNDNNKNNKNVKTKNQFGEAKMEGDDIYGFEILKKLKYRCIIGKALTNGINNLVGMYDRQYDVKLKALATKVRNVQKPSRMVTKATTSDVDIVRCMHAKTGISGFIKKTAGFEFDVLYEGCEPEMISDNDGYTFVIFSRRKGYSGDCYIQFYYGVYDYFTLLNI